MEHSTFVENGNSGDSLDKLKFLIEGAGKTKPVYILAMSTEDCSFAEIKEKTKDIPMINAVHQVNGTIDIIVKGEDQAKIIAHELYRRTRAPIGAVMYEGQDIGNLYLDIRDAIYTARKEGRTVHFYNPGKDSLQAIIKNTLAQTDKPENH